MLTYLTLLLTLLLLHDVATAQSVWQDVRAPLQNQAKAFGYNPATRTLLVATIPKGVSRSTDLGESWTSVDTTLTDIFSIGCDEGIFWACSRDGVLKRSLDDGFTWQHVATLGPLFTPSRDLFVDGPHLIIGRYRSTDRGQTWDTLASGSRFAQHLFRLGDLLILQNSGKLYSSTNNGDAWTPLPTVPDPNPIITLTYATAIGDTLVAFTDGISGMYVSGDTGRTWQKRSGGTWLDVTRYDATETELFASFPDSVLRSSDRGLSWHPIADPMFGGTRIVVVDSVWMSATAGLLRSIDSGRRWLQTGITPGYIDWMLPRSMPTLAFDNDTIWALSGYHLFSRGPEDRFYTLRKTFRTNDDRALFVHGNGVMEIASIGRSERSTDYGYSWTDGPDTRINSLSVTVGPWIYSPDLYRSSDQGRRWDPAYGELEERIGGRVQFLFASDTVLMAMAYVRANRPPLSLYRSTDYGESWSHIENVHPGSLLESVVRRGDTLLIGNGAAIYRTGDHGESWDSVTFADSTEWFAHFTYRDGIHYIATYPIVPDLDHPHRLLYSRDGGTEWRPIAEGLPESLILNGPQVSVAEMKTAWNGNRLYLYGPGLYMLDASTLSAAHNDIDADRSGALRIGAAPNPASGDILLRYTLDRRAHVRITLHDLLGRPLFLLVDGMREEGEQEVRIDGESIGGGMVICSVHVGERRVSIPLYLLR